METLGEQEFLSFVEELCGQLVSFDWRASSAPDLDDELRRAKLVFRGSGGYKELRVQLLEHLAAMEEGPIKNAAGRLLKRV